MLGKRNQKKKEKKMKLKKATQHMDFTYCVEQKKSNKPKTHSNKINSKNFRATSGLNTITSFN